MWRTVSSVTTLLNQQTRERALEFSKIYSGRLTFESRPIECVGILLESLPIAVSALYVRNFFKKESRDNALEMVELIKDEFQNILKSVSWMDETTREASLEKAKKMTTHIGFPDELMNETKLIEYYENLTIDETNFFESMVKISQFDSNKVLRSLRKIINKNDWETHGNVAVVNAYYSSSENSIRK